MDRHEFRQIVTNSWSPDEKNVLEVHCIFPLTTFFSIPNGCTDSPGREFWSDFNCKIRRWRSHLRSRPSQPRENLK